MIDADDGTSIGDSKNLFLEKAEFFVVARNSEWSEVPETRSPDFNLKLMSGFVHGVKFSLK